MPQVALRHLPLNAIILESAPAPLAISVNISPSVDPCVHMASVKSGGLESLGASGPSPLAPTPWQNAQYFLYSAAAGGDGGGSRRNGVLDRFGRRIGGTALGMVP